jgi:hypothetical protein
MAVPVDEQTVMVTHKGERDYANGFEDPIVDDERAAQLAFQLCRDTEGLCDDSNDDDNHTNQRKTTGFGEL